jgi:flavin-dependent dehydrogenase
MVEALIVGAGPAGSVAATVLARAGVRVLVVDRARFPRDKLCGDTVNPGTRALLARLGLADGIDRLGQPLDGMIVTGERGASVRARYAGGLLARAVLRRDLDAALLGAASAAGARVEEEVLVRGPLTADDRGTLVVRGATLTGRDGRPLRLPAAITIAADGRHSTIAFALGLARHPARPRRWAVGTYFEGVAGLETAGEMHIRARHYLGVAPLAGGAANVCLVTDERRGFDEPERLLQLAVREDPMLSGRFARAVRVAPVVALGPLAVEVRAAGMPGLLLAGDASGFIDPMTGDGLRFAIQGGELAARAALALLEGRHRMPHDLLLRWRRRAFRSKWRFNRAVRAFVASPPALRAASAGARVAPGAIRRLVDIAGDVSLADR